MYIPTFNNILIRIYREYEKKSEKVAVTQKKKKIINECFTRL